MRKIYGIFRGFPGLGRVSSGIALLKEFEKRGCIIGAVSYYQGTEALANQNIPVLLKQCPELCDITSIGINPINEFANAIIDIILTEKPDIILMDGEPLLQSVICSVYPKEKVVSLLNPSDLYNEILPEFKKRFYHSNYLMCGTALVHGIGIDKYDYEYSGCKVYHVPTIIRPEITEIRRNCIEKKKIAGILGGGSVNSSDNFIRSTISMGIRIAETARIMKDYQFELYCNDTLISNGIKEEYDIPDNLKIHSEYVAPSVIYSDAEFVISRAGRNVASEMLYLNMKGLLFASKGDYRSVEQENNIRKITQISNGALRKVLTDDSDEKIVSVIKSMENIKPDYEFCSGNEIAYNIINEILGDSNE